MILRSGHIVPYIPKKTPAAKPVPQGGNPTPPPSNHPHGFSPITGLPLPDPSGFTDGNQCPQMFGEEGFYPSAYGVDSPYKHF